MKGNRKSRSSISAEWAFGDGHFAKLYGDRLAQSSLLDTAVATRWVFVWLLSQADAAGRYRCASVEALARAANVPLVAARKAVQELEAPDPKSTSPTKAGRRIVAIPGGWQIVNAPLYRAYRTRSQADAAARKRRERERRRAADPGKRDMSHASRSRHARGSPEGRGERVDGRCETERPDGTDRASGLSRMAPETAAAIQAAARKLEQLQPTTTARDWIQRASKIEADDSGPSRAFSDPRRRGLSEAWGAATLARLGELLEQASRPLPL